MQRREEPDFFEDDLLQDADPRIFTTSPDNPDEGRTFVWAHTRWFERVEGDETGAVDFSPVADDEQELREWLRREDQDITELDDEFAATVRDEFLEQTPLYPEAPELSSQPLPPD